MSSMARGRSSNRLSVKLGFAVGRNQFAPNDSQNAGSGPAGSHPAERFAEVGSSLLINVNMRWLIHAGT